MTIISTIITLVFRDNDRVLNFFRQKYMKHTFANMWICQQTIWLTEPLCFQYCISNEWKMHARKEGQKWTKQAYEQAVTNLTQNLNCYSLNTLGFCLVFHKICAKNGVAILHQVLNLPTFVDVAVVVVLFLPLIRWRRFIYAFRCAILLTFYALLHCYGIK